MKKILIGAVLASLAVFASAQSTNTSFFAKSEYVGKTHESKVGVQFGAFDLAAVRLASTGSATGVEVGAHANLFDYAGFKFGGGVNVGQVESLKYWSVTGNATVPLTKSLDLVGTARHRANLNGPGNSTNRFAIGLDAKVLKNVTLNASLAADYVNGKRVDGFAASVTYNF